MLHCPRERREHHEHLFVTIPVQHRPDPLAARASSPWAEGAPEGGYTHDPRGEFTHPRIPSNPILTAYREQIEDWTERVGDVCNQPALWLDAIDIYAASMNTPRPNTGWDPGADPFDLVNVWPVGSTATTDQVAHARRVFTLLGALRGLEVAR